MFLVRAQFDRGIRFLQALAGHGAERRSRFAARPESIEWRAADGFHAAAIVFPLGTSGILGTA